MAGAPENNKNAEKWTEELARDFFAQAVELSSSEGYDFIGEIARDMGSYIEVFDYLVEKFPVLGSEYQKIKRNCEANCFSNSKKGKIKEATAIVNLKSNYGWTDRQQVAVSGVNLHFDSDDSKA